MSSLPWKKAGVMGLGLSGTAASGFLARRGVAVVAADSKPLEELSAEARALKRLGVTIAAGPGRGSDRGVFAGCDVVVTSPGVPGTVPPLEGARAAGAPIIAEVDLAARHLRGALIGITGSNGKSTVTALTGRILQIAGVPSRVCGNIGTPLMQVVEEDLSLPDEEARAVRYVVELSSFQLEGIERMQPRVAVLLNLSPDHQDRYPDSSAYYAAKARLFMNQRGDDVAVVNWDDAGAREVSERLTARLFPFSLAQDLEEGAVVHDGRVVLRRGTAEEPVMEVSRIRLPGRHNLENALAASAAAAHCGAGAAAIAEGLASFRGLPHRLEFVGEAAGVAYYNDSKATNVGAAARAIEAFDVPIVLLMGGYDKGGDFESLAPVVSAPGRLRALVTFGEAGGEIASRLEGSAPGTVRSASLEEAVSAAAGCARPGDIVLLAPACASFDAYGGFAERGEHFRSIVQGMMTQAGGLG